jgi:hypothetical protein
MVVFGNGVGTNKGGNGRARIVEIGYVVTTVGIHMIEVSLLTNVWIEMLDMCKSLCPSVDRVEGSKGYS